MKNTKKIGVLISLLLISIIALGAVSAAEDVAVDDADVAVVEEVVVDDAPATDEIIDDVDANIISDTGLKGDSDDGDAVVSDASSPKNVLKAEPLRGPEDDPVGTFSELWDLIENGGTITLTKNYAYNRNVDGTTYQDGWLLPTTRYYRDGLYIDGTTTINGNGHYISGSDLVRIFDVNGATLTLNNVILKNGNSVNSQNYGQNRYGGAIYAHGNNVRLNINNCTLNDNHADGNNYRYSGGAIYSTGTTTILNSVFINNSAFNGGAFTVAGGTFNIHGSVIFDNTATNSSASSPTFGDNAFLAGGTSDWEYNWWGSNKGPENTVATTTTGTSRTIHDWFILTETLSSPTTIDVDFELYRGGTTDYKIPARLVTITTDADTCNTTTAYCPDPFVIEFTTSNDAFINASVDYEQQHLKVFAGENKKNITYLYVEVADVTLPDQPVAHVFSDIDGVYNLTLGDQIFPVTVTDGEGTYQFSGLNVGQYTLIVSRVDDPVYKTTFNTTEFEVKKMLNTLTISTETPNPTYGQDVTITHAFDPTGPTGNIIYYVDGSTTGTELDVSKDFVLSGLGAGTHTVVAKYGGDSKYGESTSNTLTITVAQATLEINVTDVTVNYPNKGNVKVNASVDGKYNITVKDKDYEVTVVDGKGNFDVTEELAAGTYDITWDIAASENYTAASGSAVYKVLHAEPDFSISGESQINYGQTNTITPTINGDATGTISYSINGSEPVSKGVKEAFVTDVLDVGTYKVTATYSGDDNYEEATVEFEFEVLPIDVIVTVENAEVAYPNTGALSLNASAPGTYTVKVGDKTYEATVTEAGVPVQVQVRDVFDADEYDVSVTAPATNNYNKVDTGNIATYTVTKAQSTMTVTYSEGTFSVTLDGVNDEKLTETYHVIIDNVDQADEGTVDGVDTFTKEGLGPGKHNVFVIFDGNKNYAGSYAQTSFDIPKATTAVVTITPTKDAYEYGENVYLDVTVKDGETGLTGPVTVSIGGIDYAITVTNGVGQAVVKGLENGTFEAKAQFLGNDKYEAANAIPATVVVKASTKITITASSEPVTYGANSFIEVSVVDGAGNPVEVAKVNVTIAGKTQEYDVTDGKVDLGKLDASQYTAVVSYVDETYELASATATVLVNPAVSELTLTTGEGTVTIAAKDKETGEPISGTATIVVDDGEPKQVTIGEDGTIEYPIDAAPGPHTVDVTFNKENYASDSGTVVVNVPKAKTTLSIEANKEEYVFGDNVVITATITSGATGTITYLVNDSVTGTEVAIGETLTLSGLAAGDYKVVAKYAGDSNYSEATSNPIEFTIAKADLTITVADVSVIYPNKGTVVVKANVDGKYTIKVNDDDYDVNVVGGEGSVPVEDVLPVGTYDIEWDVPASDNYNAASGSAKYIVSNTEPEFSISGTKEINYLQTNTITPVLNSDAEGTIEYYIGEEKVGQTAVDETFTTEVLNAGKYTIVAKYSGDTNYAPATAEFEFEVLPIDAVVTVENVEVIYPNTGTVTVSANVPGTYVVTINLKSYEVEVGAEGSGSVKVTDVFDVNKYDIAVTADLGVNYNPVSIKSAAVYSVTKAQSNMTVTYKDGTFTVTLDGVNDEKLSGKYHVIIDNVDQADEEAVNGEDTFTKDGLAPGKHSVFVIFDGNENYLGSYAQTSFDIPKMTGATVTVTTTPTKEGDEAVITITVKDGDKGLNGVVTVTLDGTDYAVDVTDGEGTLTVKNLVSTDSPEETSTTYPITAKFNGNDDYEEATGTGEQVVQDWNKVIIVISSAGETAIATLVDTDGNNINGKVSVSIDGGEAKEYDCIDGIVDINDISEGKHDVTVYFAGDETHPEATGTGPVDIGKKLIPVNLRLTLADIVYTQDAEAVVFLTATDDMGNTVNLDGTVKVTIGDKSQEVTVTEGKGTAKFSGLDANSYTPYAIFDSDGTYDSAMASCPLLVRQLNTRIIANDMTTTAFNVTEDGRVGEYFTWTLVDEKGRPLVGKPVSIGFNAKVYNKTTDANGQAKLQINLQRANTYTFAITYLGDNNYNGSFKVVKIVVNKQKALLTAPNKTYKASATTKTLTATYKTRDGHPTVGRVIRFTVNGKTYSGITDANGVAKVKVSLNTKGTYSVQVTAIATSTYLEVTKRLNLKIT